MTIVQVVVLLVGASAGAALGRLLRLPLWPVTGSIVGAAITHLLVGGSTTVPVWWSITGQVLVGSAVGSAIGPAVLRDFRAVLAPGVLAVAAMILVGIGCGLAITATGLLDPTEAVFGMIPGGVGEMVAAATALNADSAVVAGMHVARLLVVLSAVPLLIRWAGRWDSGPAGGRDPE